MTIIRPAGISDVEFVVIVEAGPLEAQAVLLVESLRAYGGRHARASVSAVSPRMTRRPTRETVRALRRAGADYLALEVSGACPDYPTSWRLHTLAELERRPGPPVIVQLDSDTVFLDDVGPLCVDGLASARPVDVKGMGSTGPGDPFEPYWEALCGLAGVGVDDLPFVEATVDGARVRATHNGGFVASQRSNRLFQTADELFRSSVEADLRPHRDLGLSVVSGVGEVGKAGSEWWGSAQAVVSVAAASLGFEIGPLPTGVNVPMHSWAELPVKPTAVQHAHYHWLLAEPIGPAGPMFDPAVLGSPAKLDWLSRRTPLALGPPARRPVLKRLRGAGRSR
ncbi:MAG: hypothetical protein JWM76_1319 [Pseudonocardiales bacterium]|nr:hypothetical protein [Pseudonocardiales bacterium]